MSWERKVHDECWFNQFINGELCQTITYDDSSVKLACDDSDTVFLAKNDIMMIFNELDMKGEYPDQKDLNVYFTASARTAGNSSGVAAEHLSKIWKI